MRDYPGAKFKSFEKLEEAYEFLRTTDPPKPAYPVKSKVQPSSQPPPTQNKPHTVLPTSFGSNSFQPASQPLPTQNKPQTVLPTAFGSNSFQPLRQLPQPVANTNKQQVTIVWTDGSASNNGKPNCRSGAGVFFGPADPRNCAARVPGEKQSSQRGEVYVAVFKYFFALTRF